MKGCELVFHTASPFINMVKDPQKDLVDPALIGTKNVLGSVNRTASVRRVVLTSSCAAIIGDAKMISKNVGYHWLVDHSKSIKELGIKYRPVDKSIIDFFQQMIDNKVFQNGGK